MYETIDGKWHEFSEGKPPRPLTDAEAVKVIWGDGVAIAKIRPCQYCAGEPVIKFYENVFNLVHACRFCQYSIKDDSRYDVIHTWNIRNTPVGHLPSQLD